MEALRDADAVVLVTEWAGVRPARLAGGVKAHAPAVRRRRAQLPRPETLPRAGFEYDGVGTGDLGAGAGPGRQRLSPAHE